MLTDEQARVVADAIVLRGSEQDRELWFAIDDDALAVADALCLSGHLRYRYDHDQNDILYRVSDAAYRAQTRYALDAMIADQISEN